MIIYSSKKNNIIYSEQKENISAENRNYINDLKYKLKTGRGLMNTALKYMPEMHMSLPKTVTSEFVPEGSFNNTGKYSYCGPGTKVQKRVSEGYQGVNSLDEACKQHDLFYSKYKTTKARNHSDDVLASKASKIVLNTNTPEYERNDAKLVTAIMGAKSRFGMGIKKKKLAVNRSEKFRKIIL